jgi:hypothetical protein
MDIAAWLQDLGLERYAPAFRDNDVDAEVLRKLTADDLISIGVTSVGHRRKLLDAIAEFGKAGATGTAPTAIVTAAPSDAPAPPADAERRQLTVMFCDLVGSTALSTRHDPEDLRELIGDYHRAVAETVGRFDGFVAKYMGDGVLIYFGYPQAHEDDAERAVRAGLAVVEAVGQLPAREDLSVRLGIATGLAVVGDLIGEGGIASWMRQARDKALRDRFDNRCEYYRHSAGCLLRGAQGHTGIGENHIGCQVQQFRHSDASPLVIGCTPAIVDLKIAADNPAKLLEFLPESREPALSFLVTFGELYHYANAPHPLGLLRASIERPHERHAAERRYEVSSADFDCHLPHALHQGHDIMPQSAGLDPQARQLSGVLLPRLC